MGDLFERQREMMVSSQIEARGIRDPRVLAAMKKVPRHLFIPHDEKNSSYADTPLSIGYNQTISQPYIVAYMTELLELRGKERILELGTGSGYQTGVLAELVNEVFTIEVIEALSKNAQRILESELSYTNIHFKCANGRNGWEEYAPFERILMTAAPEFFPESLFDQLSEGGMVVAPVGDYFQRIIRYRKKSGKILSEPLIAVAFVPFI